MLVYASQRDSLAAGIWLVYWPTGYGLQDHDERLNIPPRVSLNHSPRHSSTRIKFGGEQLVTEY